MQIDQNFSLLLQSNNSVSTADMLKRMNLHTKQVAANSDLDHSSAEIPLTSIKAENNEEIANWKWNRKLKSQIEIE